MLFGASVVLKVFGHKVLCVGSQEGLSQTASDEVTFKRPPSARLPWQDVSVTVMCPKDEPPTLKH